MRPSPLQQLYDRFGDDERSTDARQAAKQALVKAVQALVKKGDFLDDDFSDKGLERVSNRKLLKLLDLAEKIKEEFGTRAALVDKVIELEGRVKDGGFRERLEGLRLPPLYDQYKAAIKRAKKRESASA
jgi:hypothetical protein